MFCSQIGQAVDCGRIGGRSQVSMEYLDTLVYMGSLEAGLNGVPWH